MHQNLFRALFLVCLLATSCTYGMFSTRYNWLPWPFVSEAARALQDWQSIYKPAPENQLAGFQQFEMDTALLERGWPGPGAAANQLVLVTGGPYRLMEHCPQFGCAAWITDRAGNIRHTWELDLDEAFRETGNILGRTDPEFFYPWGMHLYPDGSLLLIYENSHAYPYAFGLYKINREGRILWKRPDLSHHWMDVAEDGRIFVPAMKLGAENRQIGVSAEQFNCKKSNILHDYIRILTPDGELEQELSVTGMLLRAGYAGLLANSRAPCDPTHLNSVQFMRHSGTRKPERETVLISMRNINAIATVDLKGQSIQQLVAGRTIVQHSAKRLPSGEVIVLDNLGGNIKAGGSQVVAMDLDTGDTIPIFPGMDTPQDVFPIWTRIGGHIDLSADGKRALLSLFDQGRALEFDIETGAVLWRYSNVHRMPDKIREQLGWTDPGQELVRFKMVGAYYVNDVSFLDQPQSKPH